MAEHKDKESDKDVALLLQSILLTCHWIEETKYPCVIFIENKKYFYKYKHGQDQENLYWEKELQSIHRTYEAADDHVVSFINTGLKDTITKSYEHHEEIKITNSTNQSDVKKM